MPWGEPPSPERRGAPRRRAPRGHVAHVARRVGQAEQHALELSAVARATRPQQGLLEQRSTAERITLQARDVALQLQRLALADGIAERLRERERLVGGRTYAREVALLRRQLPDAVQQPDARGLRVAGPAVAARNVSNQWRPSLK